MSPEALCPHCSSPLKGNDDYRRNDYGLPEFTCDTCVKKGGIYQSGHIFQSKLCEERCKLVKLTHAAQAVIDSSPNTDDINALFNTIKEQAK